MALATGSPSFGLQPFGGTALSIFKTLAGLRLDYRLEAWQEMAVRTGIEPVPADRQSAILAAKLTDFNMNHKILDKYRGYLS